MLKSIIRFTSVLLVLLVFLAIPGRLVFGMTQNQVSLQDDATTTPTTTELVVPTFTATATALPPVPTQVDILQIPGILQTTPEPVFDEATETFSFENFRFEELTLRGPFAATGYYFDLPPTWEMLPGAELRLVLDTFYTGNGNATAQAPVTNSYGGTLLIEYNYVNLATIDLSREGHSQIAIPIPLDILTRLGSSDSQSLQFILDSGVNCDVDFRTTVIVRTNSQLYFPHEVREPVADLRSLPAPFFINSFNRYSVLLVIPDNPTAGELQAALSVSAGLGRMTFNRLDVSLLPVSQVNAGLLASTNVIFVGTAKNLPLLQQLSLPVPVADNSFILKDAAPSDGIVQMMVSPWNNNKVIMVVGGNEDAAVIKAARALSTGSLQVGQDPSTSVISDVQPTSPEYNETDVNRTLEDLGYNSTVVSQVGLNSISYTFDVPQNYMLGPDAYLDLFFSHSSLLEYDRSNIVVKLNEEPIGSTRLSDQNTGQGQAKVLLPASAVRPGSNRLQLDIYMEANNECINPLFEGLWTRIDSSSLLHLPIVPNPAQTSILVDLSRYPVPFAFDPIMNDLAFVLAPNDPIGWNIASKLAVSLGNTNAIQLAGLNAYYADAVPDEAKQERNLIIVGKPSKLAILSDLYDFLPAPFESGSDLALEKNLQVSYRLSPGVDLGYVELLESPWNDKTNILYVGGSSDLGLKWAGISLQLGRLRSQLKGNLAFVSGEQIVTADTRILQGAQGVLPIASPVSVTPQTGQTQSSTVERQSWILPMLYIVGGAILLVLIILGTQALINRRRGT